MEVPSKDADGRSTLRVLITGANSGLGFSTCCRLIDEFLATRPQSQTLHLLYSTRDTKKSQETLKRLNAHLQNFLKDANRDTPGASLLLEPRIKLEGVLVDLTKLITVKALAKQLLSRKQRIDAIIWNAGIPGWSGINYPLATWTILTNIVDATTYPTYMVCDVGLLCGRQLAGYDKVHTLPEPPLGQVFCANVFGHYMLTHWLTPLMDAESRIVAVSSTSALSNMFSAHDLQGIQSKETYESSKRLTDLLFITSALPSTQFAINTFLPSPNPSPSSKSTVNPNRPQLLLTHPGVIKTAISGTGWFMGILMLCGFYIARWLGSAWHPIDPYKGALAAVFAVLAPPSQLADYEDRDGKGKWGSATDAFGNERVARIEVEGWGYGGEPGKIPAGSVRNQRSGYLVTTKEGREDFEELARTVWKEMETLRVEWEARLGAIDADAASSIDT